MVLAPEETTPATTAPSVCTRYFPIIDYWQRLKIPTSYHRSKSCNYSLCSTWGSKRLAWGWNISLCPCWGAGIPAGVIRIALAGLLIVKMQSNKLPTQGGSNTTYSPESLGWNLQQWALMYQSLQISLWGCSWACRKQGPPEALARAFFLTSTQIEQMNPR